MENEEEKSDDDDKSVTNHIPHVFALRDPSYEFCEMILTTTKRQSHVFHFTYQQMRLLAQQAASAVANWPTQSKLKGGKGKS